MSIQLREVSKSFGDHQALEPIDLDIEQGEFVTLLGPSGCGKTTLLRIVAGFVTPTTGRVLLDGRDITDEPQNQRKVGLLFQSYALFPHMTVAGNVAFGPRLRRLPKKQVAQRVEEMLALVSMSEHAHRYPRQLSGGQQQRVALARILAIEPRVLLLDEPLAALDRKLRMQMQLELARLIERVGITTIFVTHDQDEALTMSDRVAVMDRGTVVQFDTPTRIYDYPATAFVASFVGNSKLFEGTVRADAGGVVFHTGDTRIPLPPACQNVDSGAATLLIRPEHIAVRPAGTDTGLPATITDVRPVGDAIDYELRLGSGLVMRAKAARGRNESMLMAGNTVAVEFTGPDACWLIPGGTGSRPSSGQLAAAARGRT